MPLHVRLKDGHTVEVIRRHAHDFTALTGIDVRLEVVPEGEAHDAFTGDPRPDVVTVPMWYLDELIGKEVLRPVDDLVRETPLDWGDFAPTAVAALTRGAQRWVVPHTLTGGVLSYRADLFDRLDLAAPASTEDVLRAAQAINEVCPDHHGLVARASPEFSSWETYAGWAWGERAKLLPDEGDPCPATLQSALGGLCAALRSSGPADLTRRSYAQVGELVLLGKAAQLFDTSAWGFFFEDPAVSTVTGRMAYTTIRGSRAPAQFLYSEGLGVTSWCRQPQAAAAFVAWRHSSRTVRCEVEEVGRIDLPRTDLWNTDWYQAEVGRRRLDAYMSVVRQAWQEAETLHVAVRPDFVRQARDLMQVVSAVVGGEGEGEAAAGLSRRGERGGLG